MRTKDKVDSILSEIEEKNSEVRNLGSSNTISAQDVADAYNNNGANLNFAVPPTQITGDDSNLMNELGAINQHHQTTFAREFPAAGGVRKILNLGKKLYWKIRVKINHPLFDEQNAFNAHTVASINELNRIRCEYEYEFTNMRAVIDNLMSQNNELTKRVDKLQGIVNTMGLSTGCGLSDVEYEAFEDNFRGPVEEIKERLKFYIPYYNHTKTPMMEIGSGRGEFLSLMKENGVNAFGIDIFEPFVNRCRRDGHNVVLGDGVTYIKKLNDNSLGGIFAAQVIEHITTEDLITLCREAYRTLQSGAYAIFETPNPTCLSIYTNAFYVDPSHYKPVHPVFVKYILEMVGFDDVKVVFTDMSKCNFSIPFIQGDDVIANCRDVNDAIGALNEKLFGSQDYAIIARKS